MAHSGFWPENLSASPNTGLIYAFAVMPLDVASSELLPSLISLLNPPRSWVKVEWAWSITLVSRFLAAFWLLESTVVCSKNAIAASVPAPTMAMIAAATTSSTSEKPRATNFEVVVIP